MALRSLWGGLGTVPGPSLGGRRPRWRSAAPGEAIFARTTTLFRAYPPWAASPLPRSSAWRGGAVKSVTFRLRNCVQSTRNRLKRRSCQASMCSVCGLGECLIVGSYMCPPPPSTWTILRGACLGGWAEPTPIEGIVSKYDHPYGLQGGLITLLVRADRRVMRAHTMENLKPKVCNLTFELRGSCKQLGDASTVRSGGPRPAMLPMSLALFPCAPALALWT